MAVDIRQISPQGILWIRRAVVAFLLLLVIHSEDRCRILREPQTSHSFYERAINCVIDTRNDIYSRNGLRAGFNYQLLKSFAQDHRCSLSVRIASGEESPLDSLLSGAIDILVMSVTDPAGADSSLVSVSRCIDNRSAWYLHAASLEELKDVNLWLTSFEGTPGYEELRSNFYTEYDPYMRVRIGIKSRRLSPYDNLIRKYADTLGWDWRMLTALIYQESRFSISTRSARGATGLMQVMPSTARHYGITDLLDPEQNLIAGTRHLAAIQKAFTGDEFTPEERVNFTLAAYNAGEGRISDCRLFAAKKGKRINKWEDIASVIPEMEEYTIESEDSTQVRTGSFKGTETLAYINLVHDLYEAFCEICPE